MTLRMPRAVQWIVLGCLAAGLAWLGPKQLAPLRVASTWLDDVRFAYLAAPRAANADVVVLTITEDTLAGFPFRSPVDRLYLAGLLEELGARDVRAVGLDLIFDQSTVAEHDERLRSVMDAFPKPLVVAIGDTIHGLTPRQLEFQRKYLLGRRSGSGGLLTTDGVVRHIYPGRVVDGKLQPSFTVELARSIGLEVPVEPELLNYLVRTETGAAPFRSFPSHRLRLLPPRWFEDAVVIIGAELPNQDRYRTPLSVLSGDFTTMPGAQIHAHALAQLIDGVEFPAPSEWTTWSILLGAVALGLMLPAARLHFTLKLMAGAAIVGACWFLGFYTFGQGGPLVPLAAPTLGFLLGLSFSSAYGRYLTGAEKRFMREAFGRYVSPSVIEEILAEPAKLKIGGEQREMSYVFTDLAGFTSLSESSDPELVVALLQSYFGGLLEIALRFDGTVDRLVGDGVNVIFNAPTNQPDHAERAVRCALECDRYCESFRREQAAKGMSFGVTRIGVHTGLGIAGNVGSAERFQYTAHGDAINIAARLESANKRFGTRVCMSAASAAHCPDLTFRPIGHIVLRGKSRGLDCVTLCDGLPAAAALEYRRAYGLLERLDPAGRAAFVALKERYPNDPLIAFHLERLSRGELGTTILMEHDHV